MRGDRLDPSAQAEVDARTSENQPPNKLPVLGKKDSEDMMEKEDAALLARQRKRLQETNPDHLSCREGGDRHRWHRVRPDWPKHNGTIRVAKQCDVCFTVVRFEHGAKYGEITKRPVYDYPPDYLVKRDKAAATHERLVSAAAVRLELAKRAEADLPEIMPFEDSPAE